MVQPRENNGTNQTISMCLTLVRKIVQVSERDGEENAITICTKLNNQKKKKKNYYLQKKTDTTNCCGRNEIVHYMS